MKLHILIEKNSVLPVRLYGGTERVVWYLAEELFKRGHKVSLLAEKGSINPFGDLIIRDKNIPIESQIPDSVDIVHFNSYSRGINNKPYITTIHGNIKTDFRPQNAVYVSKNHAERHNSSHYVYNGLNWVDYGKVDLIKPRKHYHFLGKAAWKVKNVKGAINIINQTKNETLKVLGGHRLNLKMGFRFTLSPNVKFYGMIGGEEKNNFLETSKGLIFPVLWDEPFGLAIIESLYMGAPVFGSQRGSLPELIHNEVGFLSNNESLIAEAIKENNFDRKICHEYAKDCFNAKIMADEYLKKYETVLNSHNHTL